MDSIHKPAVKRNVLKTTKKMKTQYLEITKLPNGNLKLDLTIDGATLIESLQKGIGVPESNIIKAVSEGLTFYHLDATKIWCGEFFGNEFHKTDEWTCIPNGPSKSFLEEGYTFTYKYEKEASEERRRYLTAKRAATNWAVFSRDKVIDTAIEINNRHQRLAKACYKLMEAQEVFEYDKYKHDEEYFNKIKDSCDYIQKEMDYCMAKMDILRVITKNDVTSNRIVSDMYKESKNTSHEPETTNT